MCKNKNKNVSDDKMTASTCVFRLCLVYESLSLRVNQVTKAQPRTPEQLRRTGLIPYTALRTVLKATGAHCGAPLTVRVQFGPFYSHWGTDLTVKTRESNPWSQATKSAPSL